MNIKPDQLDDTIVKESQVMPKLPKNYKVILLSHQDRRLQGHPWPA